MTRFSYRTRTGSRIRVFNRESKSDLAGLAQNTHIYDEKRSLRRSGSDNSAKLLASRNSHSWADIGPENAISVEDLRYPENRRRGGPADTPRAHNSDRGIFGDDVLKLSHTPCWLPECCASGVPRRISLGFAHSTAAA